ncbi:hypothetical protein [Pantoea sp. KPR_PJ]|uniref:hypothetical protein n=1 Tax=Pantoea sp. KPR_PJ TaxID=2738375 RepID=UPI003528F0C5
MERLTQRVDRLEQNTHQIKTELAVLTERAQHFATKRDVEALWTGQFKLRCEMLEGFARIEKQNSEQAGRINAINVRLDEALKRNDDRDGHSDEKFERIDQRFDRMDEKFERIDVRLERMDEKFERIDVRLERMDEKFERIDDRFQRIDEKFVRIDDKFDHLNDRITWTLLVPAVLAVLGWVAREFWLLR